jgi:hypothetical protein
LSGNHSIDTLILKGGGGAISKRANTGRRGVKSELSKVIVIASAIIIRVRKRKVSRRVELREGIGLIEIDRNGIIAIIVSFQ